MKKLVLALFALALLTIPTLADPAPPDMSASRPPLTRDPFHLPAKEIPTPSPTPHLGGIPGGNPADTGTPVGKPTPTVSCPTGVALMGVVSTPSHRVALLAYKNDVLTVKPGDRVGDAHVASIGNDNIELVAGAQHERILLHAPTEHKLMPWTNPVQG